VERIEELVEVHILRTVTGKMDLLHRTERLDQAERPAHKMTMERERMRWIQDSQDSHKVGQIEVSVRSMTKERSMRMELELELAKTDLLDMRQLPFHTRDIRQVGRHCTWMTYGENVVEVPCCVLHNILDLHYLLIAYALPAEAYERISSGEKLLQSL